MARSASGEVGLARPDLGKIGTGGALLPRQGDRVQNRAFGEQAGHAGNRRLGIIADIIGGQIMDLLDKGIANDLGRIGTGSVSLMT
ncbi:hypothetical protein ACFSUK_25185 [Sphingobium scionense]